MGNSSLQDFHFARRSVRRCLVFVSFAAKQTKPQPKHRICISVSERAGGEELCCWEGAALKMWSCWHGFYTEQLLHRGALHRGTLHGGAFTQRSLYTGRTLHRESFTQRNFHTGKVLHTEAFTQRSLYT